MAVQKSQYFILKYDSVALGKIKSMTLTAGGKEINVSNFDSGVFEAFFKGRNNVTMDVTCIQDHTDTTGQGNVIDDWIALANDAPLYFGPDATPAAGDITYSGTGFPISWNINASDDEAVEISFSFRINGALTKATAT
jgi:hypothetical protein